MYFAMVAATERYPGQVLEAVQIADDAHPRGAGRQMVINKAVLTLPVPRRIRDRGHVKSVAKQPCLVCDFTTQMCELLRRDVRRRAHHQIRARRFGREIRALARGTRGRNLSPPPMLTKSPR